MLLEYFLSHLLFLKHSWCRFDLFFFFFCFFLLPFLPSYYLVNFAHAVSHQPLNGQVKEGLSPLQSGVEHRAKCEVILIRSPLTNFMLVRGEQSKRYITACCNYPSRLLQCSVNNTPMNDELEGGGVGTLRTGPDLSGQSAPCYELRVIQHYCR